VIAAVVFIVICIGFAMMVDRSIRPDIERGDESCDESCDYADREDAP
jgi:hypothetical protein